MNKIINRTWMKVLAFVLCLIGAAGMIISACVVIFYFGLSYDNYDKTKFTQLLRENMATNYAAQLLRNTDLSGEVEEMELDGIDGGNLSYTVALKNSGVDGEEDTYTILYSNCNDEINENNYQYVYSAMEKGSISIQYPASMISMALTTPATSTDASYTEVSVNDYVYNEADGIFYMEIGEGENLRYIPISHIQLETENDLIEFVLDYDDTDANNKEKWKYLSTSGRQELDTSLYKTGQNLRFDWNDEAVTTKQATDESGNSIINAENTLFLGFDYSTYGSRYVSFDNPDFDFGGNYWIFMEVEDKTKAGLVMNNGMEDYFYEADQLVSSIYTVESAQIPLLIASILIFIAGLVILINAAGHRKDSDEIVLRVWDRIPFGIYTTAVGILVFIGMSGNILLFQESFFYLELGNFVALQLLFYVFWMSLGLWYLMSVAVRIKSGQFWRYTILHYLLMPFRKVGGYARDNVSLFWKTIVVLGMITFAQFLVIICTTYNSSGEVMLFVLYKIVEVAAVLWILFQMDKIKEGGKRVANGDYTTPIDTKGMVWDFKKHAENINQVGDGISLAVEERMKSERFKTELITNVSHDIKTPLTSIINYVDLIKKEDIQNETLNEYVEVLDRQSARLKKLIEDLMEASKASTGNLSVELEQCDAAVMLSQVVGEFQERTEANNLELIVSGPEVPVEIMADGRHLWRVFDNLMSNICKYAQPGTRVYVDVQKNNGIVLMTFRNISKYQLNITSEELMERFVRGDSSRNTEGNGLGLSIAQSLTNLMHGTMRLDVDGDLFKVTLAFPEII